MIADLIQRLTDVPAPVIVVAVALLACAETAAFIGLAAPGELSVVFGGVLAYQGRVPLGAVIAAAVGGAIVGDSLGFWLGRRFGVRLADGRIARLLGPDRVTRTMARIRAGGMKAIVLGRFVGVLRAVMPFAAGAARVPYHRFLAASVIGATAWGSGFTLLGYLAGNSWRRVEHYAGRASTVLAIVVVIVVLLVLLARRLAARQDRVRAAWARTLARPRVAAFHGRYHRQIEFLVGRFRPGPAAGLQLTASLVALALLAYAVGAIVGQVTDLTGLAALDGDVREALSDQPPRVVRAARSVHEALGPVGAAAIAALVGLVAWIRDRRPRALLMLILAVGGSLALVDAVGALFTRTDPFLRVPALRGHTFPARATTVVAATVVALLAVLLPRLSRWHHAVVLAVTALGVVITAGLAELIAARAFLADTVGGAALGATWGLAVATAITTIWRPNRRQAAVDPDVHALTPSG